MRSVGDRLCIGIGLGLGVAMVLVSVQTSFADEHAITRLARRLQRTPIEIETEIPETARPLFEALRDAVRDWAIAQVQAGRIPAFADDPIDEALQAELDALVPTRTDESDFRYGASVQVAVEQVSGRPELVAVQVTLDVPYGCDTSLTLLEYGDGGWQRVLADRSDAPATIDDAWCDFAYAVSARDALGDYFVVTANVNPWPTSNWQSLRWHVLRPGVTVGAPQVLASSSDMLFIDSDPVFELSIASNSFSLDFVTDHGCDIDDGFTHKRRTFVVVGAQVAEQWRAGARGLCTFFPDWISAPWPEAASWADPNASPNVERWHERLRAWNHEIELFDASIGEARKCARDPERMQAQVDLRAGWRRVGADVEAQSVPGAPRALFVALRVRDGEPRVTDIASTPASGCPGYESPG